MKNITSLLFISCLFFSSGCRQNTSDLEVKNLQSQLDAAKQEIKKLTASAETKKQLVHIVWFKMKPEADKSGLITEIKKLESIDFLKNLEVGKFQDLGDVRAMSDLDLVMQMSFDSEEEYKNYQAHPLHLALKKAAGQYLAGAPVTYDFWTE